VFRGTKLGEEQLIYAEVQGEETFFEFNLKNLGRVWCSY
jgi:hypothetical protein